MFQGMGHYNVWCQRHREPDLVIPAIRLNSEPIPALEFEHAVRMHIAASPDAEMYRRRPDGTWVYGPWQLFPTRYEAEDAYLNAA